MDIQELNTQIEYLNETKGLLRQAIINKGQSIGINDTFRSYVDKVNNITNINLQSKNVTPTTSQILVEPDAQYNGLSSVRVDAVTSAIDSNIINTNIKSGITILGITGTYAGTDTSDANANSSDILLNKTAYVNGVKITGTIPNNGILNYGASTSSQTIPAGYTSGGTISAVTSAIDSNIQAANIKSGITILGITGTFTSDGNALASEIAAGKIAYVNGNRLVGTGAITFATETEMNQHTNLPENTLAIVYGTTYVGTYKLDSGVWTQIGTSSDEQLMMNNLNAVMDSTDEYEGIGGTEEQLNAMLDNILGNNE